jgi:anti-anti-sigma factor
MTETARSRRRSTAGTGTRTVVVLTGELDLLSVPSLRRRLREAPGGSEVIVDLSGVTFMDCSTVTPLLEARQRFGPRLLLRRPSPAALRLLRLTGLLESFALADGALGLVSTATGPGATVPDQRAPSEDTPHRRAPGIVRADVTNDTGRARAVLS